MSKVMNRCPKCNTELVAQARFCNVCGFPQKSTQPLSQESVPIEQDPANMPNTNRCQKCDTILPAEALFCTTCGAPQTTKEESSTASAPGEQDTAQPAPDPANATPDTPQPAQTKSLNPTRTIQPTTKKAPNAHPPVLPKRPTSSKVKSPAALPQHAPSIPDNAADSTILSETPTVALPDISTPATSPDQPKPAAAEQIANTPTQSLPEPPSPARTPGIIRPIGTPVPARPVIASTPGLLEKATALQSQSKQASVPPTPLPSVPPLKKPTAARPQHAQTQNKQPLAGLPAGHLSPRAARGQNAVADMETMNLHSPESFAATSRAAEHWRKSWRDRQYAEAGPAEAVSRGHASVPAPLMAMQHSFARMRAITRPKNEQQQGRNTHFRSWITIFLMLCIIAGLGTYVISTYLPNFPFGAVRVALPANASQPSLTIQGKASATATFAIGSTIHLHGEHFSPNDTITFLLDTTIPITGSNGNKISARANGQGAFDVAFPIVGSDWTAGSPHLIEAQGTKSNQDAYLTIQVNPAATPETSSPNLSITTTDGNPITKLTFNAVLGQANPAPQGITITNTSNASLTWSATAIAGNITTTSKTASKLSPTATPANNLSWLIINDNHTDGVLAISQPDTLLISVNTVGLQLTASTNPYKGQIVFTINNKELLTLPVQLRIGNATPEMVFSPSPLIAQASDSCQSATLTLINLGTATISWTVQPDANVSRNIQFVDPATGKLMEHGVLLSSGSSEDTQVLALRCYNIKVGRPYHVSVYANTMQSSEIVIIQ